MSDVQAPAQPTAGPARPGAVRRFVNLVGVDNLSLIVALALLGGAIRFVSPLLGIEGGENFLSWQNLMNSLAQSVVIVGLLAVGETVVIVGGALDISVGSIASVASVLAAIAVTQGVMGVFRRLGPFSDPCRDDAGLFAGRQRLHRHRAQGQPDHRHAGHAGCLRRPGLPACSRTASRRDRDATRISPGLATGRFLRSCPCPRWAAVNGRACRSCSRSCSWWSPRSCTSSCATRTSDGRSMRRRQCDGGPPAGINVRQVVIAMYLCSGGSPVWPGVLLTARTTSGNPINGRGLELQAITAVFLGGAATAGGRGTIVGTVLAVLLVGVLNNGMNLLGVGRSTSGSRWVCCSSSRSPSRSGARARSERARARTAALG